MPLHEQEQYINDILQQYDPYILKLVWQKMPRSIVPIDVIDLEIDELAQIVRCKVWLALQREQIINIKAYIYCIVQHEVVNIIRRHCSHRAHQPLVVDELGELREGRVLIEPGEGMQNPSDEFEQKETANDCVFQITKTVKALPPRQQHAMICLLKDRVDDLLPLIDAFLYHNINIETVSWPTEKDENHKLRSSLSITRKKLGFLKRAKQEV